MGMIKVKSENISGFKAQTGVAPIQPLSAHLRQRPCPFQGLSRARVFISFCQPIRYSFVLRLWLRTSIASITLPHRCLIYSSPNSLIAIKSVFQDLLPISVREEGAETRDLLASKLRAPRERPLHSAYTAPRSCPTTQYYPSLHRLMR